MCRVSDAECMNLSSRFGIEPSRAASAIECPNQHQYLKEKCAPVRGAFRMADREKKSPTAEKEKTQKSAVETAIRYQRAKHKKSADCESALEEAATYSPTTKCSTIGVVRLNFSVRNGKRWDPHAITTLVRFQCACHFWLLPHL